MDGDSGGAAWRRPNRARLLWLLATLALFAALCLLSIAVGSRCVPWSEIFSALGGATDTIGEAAVTKRIPRTVMAALAGASLALCGAAMQGATRNPLAEPGLLGINMGAALAVVVGMVWFGLATAAAYVWTAIAGAAVAAVFVYAVASLGRGGVTPLKLALAGAATTVAFTSFVTAIVLRRSDLAEGVQSWQIGGVGGATFDSVVQVLPFLAAGFLLAMLSARRLNTLALGDELAAGLGERVAIARAVAALGAVLLCGATTAVCGPIAFVGLLVPHVVRLLVGIDYRWVLPFSALGGACLLMAADIVGRIIARPMELDVGIVTAFIGAPVFIWIVRNFRVREL
ncbi:MAG: iron ABC transporter permease [Bauldia sp.]|nr:iron ABC transporter permease [Bauldia sp.]